MSSKRCGQRQKHIFTSCLPCCNSSRDGVQAEAIFPSKVIKISLNVKARLRLFYS